MLNRVRFLTLIASAALWCGTNLNATEVIEQDLNDLSLTDGASDGYWYAGLNNWLTPSPFCADPVNAVLPMCLTASAYPWFAGWGYAGAWTGWAGGDCGAGYGWAGGWGGGGGGWGGGGGGWGRGGRGGHGHKGHHRGGHRGGGRGRR